MESLFRFDLDDDSWLAKVRECSAPPAFGRIGPYELLDEAGRGGQGVVYKARQPQTGRIIAVKRLLAGSLASREMRVRFDREIEAAAALDHPGIVTVFASEIVDGQAVLAMQWVDGQPVDRWAGSIQDVRDVLAVFAKICDAVHHAHQRGVIHRDLKPSNVLVDVRGEPHVLDFGLARILSPLSPESAFASHTTGFVGTPAYASPEHFSTKTDAIDVRSDVYSIGAMLYQALTGRPPFADRHRFTELARAVEQVDPPAPSSLREGLGREIDAVVLKALAKAKAERYPSVDAFAQDIRRYLDGEPVLAHPPSAWYHARKLMRRHRLAFALGFTLLAVLIAFAVTSSILAMREREAREDAEWNAYTASVAAASASLRANDAASAQQHLERAPPHLRDWEWRYFSRQADGSSASARLPHQGVAINDKGQVMATVEQALEGHLRATAGINPAAVLTRVHNRRYELSPRLRWVLNGSGTLIHVQSGQELGSWPFPASYSSRFSSDERILALADQSGELKLIALPETALPPRGAGEMGGSPNSLDVRSVRLFDVGIEGLAFRPDSRRIAASAGDGGIVIVDVSTAQVVETLPGNGSAVWAVAFSPDGRTLATGAWDKSVTLWDLHTKQPLWKSAEHRELISALAFSPDGTRLASGSWDKTIRIWGAAAGEPVAQLIGHANEVGTVAFLAGNDRLASFDSDGVLKTWNLTSLDPPVAIGSFRRIERIAGSLGSISGGWIVVAEGQDASWRSARLSLIDVRRRNKSLELWVDETSQESTTSGLFIADASPDGRWLAAGTSEGTILLWHGEELSEVVDGGMTQPVPAIRLTIDDPARCVLIAEGSSWLSATGGLVGCFPVWLSFAADSRRFAVARLDGSVDVWDLGSLTNVVMVSAGSGSESPSTAAFLGNGDRLAVVRKNEGIQVLDSRNGRIIVERHIVLGESFSQRLSGSPDGTLISILQGKDIELYRANDLTLACRLSGHQRLVTDVAFSPDGKRLVSASYDNTLKLWDVATGREVATLHGHEFRSSCVLFPDVATIVSGGHDNQVRFWDAAD